MKNVTIILVVAVMVMVVAMPVYAASYEWVGTAGDSDWATSGNWNKHNGFAYVPDPGIPGDGDAAQIVGGSAIVTTTVGTGGNVGVGLYITNGGSLRVESTGFLGIASSTSATFFSIGATSSSTGTSMFEVAGGTVDIGHYGVGIQLGRTDLATGFYSGVFRIDGSSTVTSQYYFQNNKNGSVEVIGDSVSINFDGNFRSCPDSQMKFTLSGTGDVSVMNFGGNITLDPGANVVIDASLYNGGPKTITLVQGDGTFTANMATLVLTAPAGSSLSTDGAGALQLNYVPEPATMVLLGLGGIGVLLRRRKR